MQGRGLAVLGAALVAMSIAGAPAWAASTNSGKIAFASGDPLHIWTVKPNGKALHDLNAGAPAAKTYCSPALSPDGTRIAYVDSGTKPPLESPTSNSSDSSIVIANSDGTGARVIPYAFEQGYFCVGDLSWAPDGQHLAFPGYSQTDISTSYTPGVTIINVDNPLEPARRVGDNTANTFYTARFSPDGTRIAADGDDGHVHIFRVDGGPSVTGSEYGCHVSSWSRDGARLLEDCEGPPSSTEEQGIWSFRSADLGDPQPVYLGSAFYGTYSPDGSQIALALNGQLYTLPADGSAAPALVAAQNVYGISWEAGDLSH